MDLRTKGLALLGLFLLYSGVATARTNVINHQEAYRAREIQATGVRYVDIILEKEMSVDCNDIKLVLIATASNLHDGKYFVEVQKMTTASSGLPVMDCGRNSMRTEVVRSMPFRVDARNGRANFTVVVPTGYTLRIKEG